MSVAAATVDGPIRMPYRGSFAIQATVVTLRLSAPEGILSFLDRRAVSLLFFVGIASIASAPRASACDVSLTASADPATATATFSATRSGATCSGGGVGMIVPDTDHQHSRVVSTPCGGDPCTVDFTVSTECWEPGSYTVTASATCHTVGSGSCDGEETANASTSVSILQSEVTSFGVSATPTTTPGLFELDFSYALQNLSVPRGIEWTFEDPNGTPFGTSWHSSLTQPSGVYTDYIDASCWVPGHHKVIAKTSACSVPVTAEGGLDVPSHSVSLEIKPPDGTHPTQTAYIHYDFPGTNSPTDRRLLLDWLPSPGRAGGNIYNEQAPNASGVVGPIAIEGSLSQRVLRATASACGRPVKGDAGVSPCCKDCSVPCQVGSPIRLWDGAVTYDERDPLPAAGPIAFTRAYDSANETTGRFGNGWTSLFDTGMVRATVAVDTVVVRLENNVQTVFEKQGSVWIQSWPKGAEMLDELTDETGGGWRYRQSNSSLAYHFSGGRLVRLVDERSNHAVVITWDDVTGQPLSIADERGNWSCSITTTGGLITQIAVDGEPDLTWNYSYSGNLLESVALDGETAWRTYDYTSGRLSAVHDAAGNLVESHAYDSSGRGTSSVAASDDITSVQYVAGTDGLTTHVTYATGREETYAQSFTTGRPRTLASDGGCTSCGARDSVYAYDLDGRLLRQQTADGYITTRTYDTAGRVTREDRFLRPAACNPATDSVHCRMTSAALATVSLSATSATTYVESDYTDSHWPDKPTVVRQPSVEVSNGVRTDSMTYDIVSGNVLTRTMTSASAASITRTDALYDGVETAAFDPGGAFDSGWLALPQPPRMTRLTDGPRTDVTDTTEFVYYPIDSSVPAVLRGHLAAVRNAAGHITRYEDYDVFGHATRVVDPNEIAQTTTYDALGRLLTSTIAGVSGCNTATDPLCATDLTVSRTYDPVSGPLASVTDAKGNVTAYEYDGRGRMSAMTRGPSAAVQQERIEYTYDADTGRRSQEKYLAKVGSSWVEKHRESFSYDELAQLSSHTHADNTSVAYTYDDMGGIASIRDENHSSANTHYEYDTAHRLAAVIQTLSTAPGGSISTTYDYDVTGNLISVTDPNGNETMYVYDDLGRMSSNTSPVTGITSYVYDPAGNLTSATDANDATTVRTYDELGRLLTAESSRAGADTETITYVYDQDYCGTGNTIGRVTAMSDPTGDTLYGYERRGLLTTESSAMPVTYTYDANGNRDSILYPSGRTVTYTYDFGNRPVTVTADSTAIVSGASYLPFGPAAQLTFGNGTTKTVTFDTRYRPTENKLVGTSGTVADYTYQEDAVGNITEIHDAVSATYNRDFSYDDLNRLVTANSGTALWGSGSYTYDSMGNMTALALGTRSLTFSHDGSTPNLTSVGGTSPKIVTYDAAGSETSAGLYSARNLYTGFLTSGTLQTTTGFENGYDGRGVRVTEATPKSGALRVTRFLYSPELHLLARLDETTFDGTDYIWFGGEPVAQGSADTLAPLRFTFTDHLGTPILQTDPDATVVWRVEYEPFGSVFAYRAGNATDPQILRLPGQERAFVAEDGTELSYNIFRWYRSGWGRYTQADPISLLGSLRVRQYPGTLPLPQGGMESIQRLLARLQGDYFKSAGAVPANTYAYGDDNPIALADAFGLEPVLCTVFRLRSKPTPSPMGSLPGNVCQFSGHCGGGPSGQVYDVPENDPFTYRFIPPCKECPIACIYTWETSIGGLTAGPLCYGQVPVNNHGGFPGGGFSAGGGSFRGKGATGGW
ncbi:MAG: RHS repeat protein [Acidobacteria bacterium]|nr:RHS repeat protein [Acidobacteriota bacterium]MBV9477939.1 RHS repeat protein [Acidobacteriota bacterium]